MRGKHLVWIAGLVCLASAPQAMAQGMVNAPAGHLQVSRAEGAPLRRVAAQDSGRLVYEYQTGAGAARVSIDPGSLVSDIEKARKRVAKKKAEAKVASVTPALPVTSAREPEMAQAEISAPVAEVAATPAVERKVRVIPLYRTPGAE
ncbi:MAG: hypothetical protein JWN07_1718 [Hyphomicrobiales bacterium]|nr:hypothetical protein [Hyphomicrobiales bacterium]